MNRREFLLVTGALALAAGCSSDASAEGTITVYRSPT